MSAGAASHAELMDQVYRLQRHVYDVTRKYYLFGRDRMIDRLAIPQRGLGVSVIEIACGTGRNLARIRAVWPGAALFGLDISAEMLKSARARLPREVRLAVGDATAFDPQALFGHGNFDRVVMAYCTSMIPEWRDAVALACRLLAPGGSLHIVDFGDMAGLPGPLRGALRWWLARFHVSPRADLAEAARGIAAAQGLLCEATVFAGGYYRLVRVERPR